MVEFAQQNYESDDSVSTKSSVCIALHNSAVAYQEENRNMQAQAAAAQQKFGGMQGTQQKTDEPVSHFVNEFNTAYLAEKEIRFG